MATFTSQVELDEMKIMKLNGCNINIKSRSEAYKLYSYVHIFRMTKSGSQTVDIIHGCIVISSM